MKTSSISCAENTICHAKPQLLGRARRKRVTLWSSRWGQMYQPQPAVSLGVLPQQTKTLGGCDRVDPAVVQVWPRWALCWGGKSSFWDAWPKWTQYFWPAGSHPHLGHLLKQRWLADSGFIQHFSQRDPRALWLLIKRCYVPFNPLGF